MRPLLYRPRETIPFHMKHHLLILLMLTGWAIAAPAQMKRSSKRGLCENNPHYTEAWVQALKPGEVALLENTRFYKAEDGKVKKDDEKKGIHLTDEEYKAKKAELKEKRAAMAKKLASYGDVYCNDAFGTAHRAHASTAVIADYIQPAVSGFLLEKELKFLGDAVDNPVHPFVAILGGAKVSDKLAVVKNLLNKADTLVVAGGMAYTFKKAQGYKVGASLCEDDQVAYCKEMLDAAAAKGVKFLLGAQVTSIKDGKVSYKMNGEDAFVEADKVLVSIGRRAVTKGVGLENIGVLMDRGRIVTDSAKVNQLVSNARWGMRDNFLDTPTDCPQRDERMGWTGDANVFSRTALLLAAPYALDRKSVV